MGARQLCRLAQVCCVVWSVALSVSCAFGVGAQTYTSSAFLEAAILTVCHGLPMFKVHSSRWAGRQEEELVRLTKHAF